MDHLDAQPAPAPDILLPAARDAPTTGPPTPAPASTGATARSRPSPADAVAGLITALFSVPEGMAYAAIAGFDPGAGLYSGIWPAVAGSLLVSTPLMIVTLTSAIALTSRSALWNAHLSPAVPANVAALTLLVALAMALFALLRLTTVLRAVSAGAMTGFSVGIAVQIIAGALHEATGYRPQHHNRLIRLVAWLTHPHAWSTTATAVAVLTVLVWATAHALERVRPLAVLIALVAVAAAVHAGGVRVKLAGSLGTIPDGLPHLTMPAWHTMPHLAGGACSVALVALAQAAGITPAHPPDPARPARP